MCCAEAWNNQHRGPQQTGGGGGGEPTRGGQTLNDIWRKQRHEDNGDFTRDKIGPKVPSSSPLPVAAENKDCNEFVGAQIVREQQHPEAPSSPQNEGGTSGSLTVECNNDVDVVVGDTHHIPHVQKQQHQQHQPPSPRGTCLAVDCNEIITAQGYLCKFHRVAKVVVLKNDESKQELRWCHYCKKVQRLDEFSEASKTLCHAKYVLRCERSKKKREKLRMKMMQEKEAMMERSTETMTYLHSGDNLNTSDYDGSSSMENAQEEKNKEYMSSELASFVASILDDNIVQEEEEMLVAALS